ncbi:MAG: hypothetical protein ACYSWX_00275 [Planctomycetota bacterium]
MSIHPSTVCALVGVTGLAATPFLPADPGAIVFMVACVALVVALGLGVTGVVAARPRREGAALGLAISVLTLAGLLSWTGMASLASVAPNDTVEASESNDG